MSEEKRIAGRLASALIELAPGRTLANVRVGSEEKLVLARMMPGRTLGELADKCGLPSHRVNEVVKGLFDAGIVIEKGASSASKVGAPEKVDLSPERQREVHDLESRYDQDPFTMLGVPANSSAAACKSAYYELSMRFHPDRFFGKELGSYRPRIDRLFRKLTEAHAATTDPVKRAALEKEKPQLFTSTPPTPKAGTSATPAPTVFEAAEAHDDIRAEDRARRIARHPYLARVSRVAETLNRAKRAIQAGQPGQAVNDLNVLLQTDPNHAEAKQLLVDAQAAAGKQRAATVAAEGFSLFAQGEYGRAIVKLTEALERQPSAALCAKGHEASVRGNDSRSDKLFCTKWVELEPKNVAARLALAEVFVTLGLDKNARREAEEATRLDPTNMKAKALAQRLRSA